MNSYIQSLIKCNYKLIGVIFFLIGAAYTARALIMVRATRGLPMVNTYLLIIGILFCISALGIYIYGTMPTGASSRRGDSPPVEGCQLCRRGDSPPVEGCQLCRRGDSPPVEGCRLCRRGGLITLLCLIIFTLTFEKIGAMKASFMLSFAFGTIWNRNIPASGEAVHKFSFFKYLSTNKLKIIENIFVSCVSVAGIWLVFERVFSLSLP